MEYIPGEELHKLLKNRGFFPNYYAKFYLAETLVALEQLHLKNIIHRDLKPENIMLDRDGHIKIIDFGFSKQVKDITRDRLTTNCGTPSYIAPEVMMG